MTRVLKLALILGALIGLFGQAAAYAAMPMAGTHVAQPVRMDHAAMTGMDCAGMDMPAPAKAPAHDPAAPCKGTLACMIAMGCVVPLVTPPGGPTLARHMVAVVPPVAATIAPLVGRSVGPELEPPSRLN